MPNTRSKLTHWWVQGRNKLAYRDLRARRGRRCSEQLHRSSRKSNKLPHVRVLSSVTADLLEISITHGFLWNNGYTKRLLRAYDAALITPPCHCAELIFHSTTIDLDPFNKESSRRSPTELGTGGITISVRPLQVISRNRKRIYCLAAVPVKLVKISHTTRNMVLVLMMGFPLRLRTMRTNVELSPDA